MVPRKICNLPSLGILSREAVFFIFLLLPVKQMLQGSSSDVHVDRKYSNPHDQKESEKEKEKL